MAGEKRQCLFFLSPPLSLPRLIHLSFLDRERRAFFSGVWKWIFSGGNVGREGRRDRFEYLTGESGTISGLRKLEGEADLIVVFFFFLFMRTKFQTRAKFSNKLIIQVQQIMQVTNSEFIFFFFFGFDFESIWWLFDCGDSKGVKLSVNVIYFIQ